MRKIATIAPILGMTLLVLTGCGGGGGGSAAPVSPIVGTFKETNLASNGQSTTCPGTVTLVDGSTYMCGTSDTLQFKMDGTFLGNLQGGEFSGTYTYANGILSIKVTAPAGATGLSNSGPATLSNNNATLTLPAQSANDSTFTYTRQ